MGDRPYRVSDLVSLKVAEEGKGCLLAVKLAMAGCKPYVDPQTRLKILEHDLAVLARRHEPEFGKSKEEFVNDYGNFVGETFAGRTPGASKRITDTKRELLEEMPLSEILKNVVGFTEALAKNRYKSRERPVETQIEKNVDSVRFGKKLTGRKDIETRFTDAVVVTEGKVKPELKDWDRYQVAIYTLMTQPSEEIPVIGKVEAWPSCETEVVDPSIYINEINDGLVTLERLRKTEQMFIPTNQGRCNSCWYVEPCLEAR